MPEQTETRICWSCGGVTVSCPGCLPGSADPVVEWLSAVLAAYLEVLTLWWSDCQLSWLPTWKCWPCGGVTVSCPGCLPGSADSVAEWLSAVLAAYLEVLTLWWSECQLSWLPTWKCWPLGGVTVSCPGCLPGSADSVVEWLSAVLASCLPGSADPVVEWLSAVLAVYLEVLTLKWSDCQLSWLPTWKCWLCGGVTVNCPGCLPGSADPVVEWLSALLAVYLEVLTLKWSDCQLSWLPTWKCWLCGGVTVSCPGCLPGSADPVVEWLSAVLAAYLEVLTLRWSDCQLSWLPNWKCWPCGGVTVSCPSCLPGSAEPVVEWLSAVLAAYLEVLTLRWSDCQLS